MEPAELPAWVTTLPAVNAGLNSIAAVLLISGYVLIRRQHRTAHQWAMLTSFAVSVAFLACYLVYHYALQKYTGSGSMPFRGTGLIRPVYYTILITHVVLAPVAAVMALITIFRAWKQDWERHRRIAKVTFPIWVYVSVTGVIIYVMVYHWPVA